MAPVKDSRRDKDRGNRIRVRREDLGLSVEMLRERRNTRGRRLLPDLTAKELEAWERGVDPGEKLHRLAEALKVSWRFLDSAADDVGTRIARLRLEREMSQKDLVVGAGLGGTNTVQAWESGRNRGIEQATLVQVARVLEASPQFLLTGEDVDVEPDDDTESRLRYLEGTVARLGAAERGGGMRGFPEITKRIAELRGQDKDASITSLRGEDTEASITSLREDVRALQGVVQILLDTVQELARPSPEEAEPGKGDSRQAGGDES